MRTLALRGCLGNFEAGSEEAELPHTRPRKRVKPRPGGSGAG